MLTVAQASTNHSAPGKQDRWIPSSCSLCYGMCSILAHNVDGVVTKIEGYAASFKPADVPPHHKSAVVVELIHAIDEIDPDIDPNS